MIDFSSYDLGVVVAIFVASGAAVLVCGVRLTSVADRLAHQSGVGGAVIGAVVLGALTSLSGSVTSVSAAAAGHPELATANAIGGIAAQTMFLVFGDIAYRRANLEHAAASLPNVLSGCLLVIMLGLILIAALLPSVTVAGVHPLTPALLLVYVVGMRAVDRSRWQQSWVPRRTDDTRLDAPDPQAPHDGSTLKLWTAILGLGAIVGGAGYLISGSALSMASELGIREGLIGALLTSIVTSTPELVTTVAAVRRGALALAVGGILGGNTFDVLFTAFSDLAYRSGSIYHTMRLDQIFLVVLTIVMTAILIFGLLHRERRGFANIGFESVCLIVLYASGMLALVWAF
ncbi:sodium:calcium antiporter [Thalassobaculum sp.]|uniref:sodium:calcium antiporter n=1 Tax=Thalassobaculum sp. TaxID=2022740 RepID=UPI0032EAEF12